MCPQLPVILLLGIVIELNSFCVSGNQTEPVTAPDETLPVSVPAASFFPPTSLDPSFVSNDTSKLVTSNSLPASVTPQLSDNITSDETTLSLNVHSSLISPSPILSSSIITEKATPSFVTSQSKSKSCACDLTVGSCDINCCCDAECSSSEKAAFSHCKSVKEWQNEWYCYDHPNIQKQNTLFKRAKLNEGMFCIVRDNLVKKKVYQEPEVIDTLAKFRKIEARQGYTWLDKFHHFTVPLKKKKLQVGDPLLLVKASDETVIDPWYVPAQLYSAGCETIMPVTYLKNLQSDCIRQLKDFDADCTQRVDLKAQLHYRNFYLIKVPILTWTGNTSNVNSSSSSDSSDSMCDRIGGCISLTLVNCHYRVNDVDSEEQSCIQNQAVPSPELAGDRSVCRNVVSEVHYTIVHDGVKGIVDGSVSVVLSNISRDNPYFRFATTVSFQSWRQSNFTYRRSGNPGYQIGEAILATPDVTEATREETELLEMDFNETTQNYLSVVGHMKNGTCSLDKTLRKNVKFGVNQQSGCILKYDFHSSSNCQDLQEKILELLLGDVPNNYVGMFGNADPQNPDDWVKILSEGKPNSNLHSLQNGVCSSIINGLHIQIMFAKVDTFRNPQLKIVGVSIKYFPSIEVSTKCFGPYCTGDLSDVAVEVVSTVSFVDVTNPVITLYAPPPVLHAKLPYDFFYPFLSQAPAFKCHYLLLICIQILSFFYMN